MDELGVIGVGNMAQAICKSIHSKKEFKHLKMKFFTPSKLKAMAMAQELNGVFCPTSDIMKGSQAYIIACKPQQFDEMAEEFLSNRVFSRDSLIISIMAGIDSQKIAQTLRTPKVVRVMPNTPLLVSRGTTLFYFNELIKNEEKAWVMSLFDGLSTNFEMKSEEQLDQISGVSGSGPAYFYEFCLSFVKKLEELGMSKEDSKNLAMETFLGSAQLLEKQFPQTKDLAYLKDQVTSKGGITEAALTYLQKKSLDSIMSGAFNAAYTRAKELNK